MYLQLYKSFNDGELEWTASKMIPEVLTGPINNVEALYQKESGFITLFVNQEEQLTVNVGSDISQGNTIALRALGKVTFTQVYVRQR